MSLKTGAAYVDLINDIASVLQTEPTQRTGLPLTTEFGNVTIISKRISDWQDITDNLPCIIVDYHPEGTDYEHDDQAAWRLIPVVCVVYIPLMTLGKSGAAADAEELKSDSVIKQVFSDLEEVLDSARTRSNVSYELMLVGGGGMQYEAFDALEDIFGVRMRVGQINLVARSRIR